MAVNFLSGPSSIIMPAPCRFHCFATSSRILSARPSSRQPLPQNLPTNVERRPNPDDVNVRLCFLVRVRKATGRSVCGGSAIGSTEGPESLVVDFCAAANACRTGGACRGLMGYAGVPKPGEDENCWSLVPEVRSGLNAGGGSRGVDTGSSMAVVTSPMSCSGQF